MEGWTCLLLRENKPLLLSTSDEPLCKVCTSLLELRHGDISRNDRTFERPRRSELTLGSLPAGTVPDLFCGIEAVFNITELAVCVSEFARILLLSLIDKSSRFEVDRPVELRPDVP